MFLSNASEANDEETKLQCTTLSYLVFLSRFDPSREYVAGYEIIRHLEGNGFSKVSEQILRSSIIAKLRDKDVIISSCNKGYRIPKSLSDLTDFVERVNSLVLPLLDRLNKARESYKFASSGEFDFLDGKKYPELAYFLSRLGV